MTEKNSLPAHLLGYAAASSLTAGQSTFSRAARKAGYSAAAGRITHELALHINELDQFFNECRQDQNECREMYPTVAEKRVMAQILADEGRELSALTLEMEKRQRETYPQDQYGFLYVSI